MKAFPNSKDPGEVDWRNFNWSRRLPADDTVLTASVTPSGPDSSLVVDQVVPSGQKVSFRWSGGTPGARYSLTCHIVSANGRTLEWSADVLVREL